MSPTIQQKQHKLKLNHSLTFKTLNQICRSKEQKHNIHHTTTLIFLHGEPEEGKIMVRINSQYIV